jgi:hypothetical protein
MLTSKPTNNKSTKTASQKSVKTASASPYFRPFDPTSITGKAVLSAFDDAVTDITIDAPPGSGKTTTLVMITKELVMNSDASVLIATPTRNQVLEIARRLIDVIPAQSIDIDLKDKPDVSAIRKLIDAKREVKSVLASSTQISGKVTLSTISRVKMGFFPQPAYHFLIVDEAYQATYGDYVNIMGCAEKHIFMGDPGQIGPVVTVPADLWASSRNINPTRRLQDVIKSSKQGTVSHTIDTTYRLGEKTTEIINSLYPFDFKSGRPETEVRIGKRSLAEIEVVDVHTPVERELPVKSDSLAVLKMVAKRCVGLINDGYVTRDGEERKLTANDIAIVVGYNYQVEEATLTMRSLCDGACPVEVTTADRAQGKEWCVVLAVDPASIPGGAGAHSFSDGRLAVMISRHYGHLTWYGTHPDELLGVYDESLISDNAIEVRSSLYTMPVIDEF